MQAVDRKQDKIELAFARVDRNGDERIEIEEFATLMLDMDRATTACEMRACFDAIDSDHDGSVTLAEFRAWYR
jgi:Ca2+-binding EF-hand superfamily protein